MIRRALNWLLSALREPTGHVTPVVAHLPNPFGVCMAEEPPLWHEHDREQLRAFFASETGKRLRAGINFQEQGRNRRAVLSGDPKAAGRAAGFHEFGAWLIDLSSADVRPQQDDHSNLHPGAREVAERLAP